MIPKWMGMLSIFRCTIMGHDLVCLLSTFTLKIIPIRASNNNSMLDNWISILATPINEIFCIKLYAKTYLQYLLSEKQKREIVILHLSKYAMIQILEQHTCSVFIGCILVQILLNLNTGVIFRSYCNFRPHMFCNKI